MADGEDFELENIGYAWSHLDRLDHDQLTRALEYIASRGQTKLQVLRADAAKAAQPARRVA